MCSLNPTPFKISTITATGSISSDIHLDTFYNATNICQHDDQCGIVYIEYGQKKQHTYSKGFHKKQVITRRKKTEAKRFDNQATIIIRLMENGNAHNINMKVFKNGNVQMTGIKYIEQGKSAIQFLIDTICDMQSRGITVVSNVNDLIVANYKIRLINSDFRVGFDIKRDKLCKIVQQKYSVFCSYEPCIYPGVKIQYNYNSLYPFEKGVCKCTSECSGKGCGSGNGECKKITIAVFQSGCVIITGAQTVDQIDKSYNFICCIIENHKDEVYKQPFTELLPNQTKKKILIRKSNIQFPNASCQGACLA